MRNANPAVLFSMAVFTLAPAALAQDAGRFAGTWKGVHEGKHYLTLTVVSGAALKIGFVAAHIHVGDSGEIDEVDGEVEHEEKVLDSKIEGGKLWFKTEQGSGDVMEYELTLDGNDGLLRVVGAPDFIKPFRLNRSSPAVRRMEQMARILPESRAV
jgi:hypothetical protein